MWGFPGGFPAGSLAWGSLGFWGLRGFFDMGVVGVVGVVDAFELVGAAVVPEESRALFLY